jgi:hypothetical protein
MFVLHRFQEPYSDVAAHDPDNLDRQPIIRRKLHRCTFSDGDSEAAVNPKAAKRVVHDDGFAAKPVTAKKGSHVNRLPSVLSSFREGLLCHGSPVVQDTDVATSDGGPCTK